MEAYSDFAYVYDIFMDNTPYEKWGGFVLDRLRRAGIEDGILLDLGCGTGNMTELLADAGYDMIGVDLSEEMLNAVSYTHLDVYKRQVFGGIQKAADVICENSFFSRT